MYLEKLILLDKMWLKLTHTLRSHFTIGYILRSCNPSRLLICIFEHLINFLFFYSPWLLIVKGRHFRKVSKEGKKVFLVFFYVYEKLPREKESKKERGCNNSNVTISILFRCLGIIGVMCVCINKINTYRNTYEFLCFVYVYFPCVIVT